MVAIFRRRERERETVNEDSLLYAAKKTATDGAVRQPQSRRDDAKEGTNTQS